MKMGTNPKPQHIVEIAIPQTKFIQKLQISIIWNFPKGRYMAHIMVVKNVTYMSNWQQPLFDVE